MKTEKIIKIIEYGLMVILAGLSLISIAKGISNGLENHPIDFLYDAFRDALYNHNQDGMPQFPSMMLHLCLLGVFSYRTSQIIWLSLQFVFTVILVVCVKKVLFKKSNTKEYIILVLIMISGAPWRTNLSNLQYSLFAVSMFFLGLYFIEKDREYLAGLIISLGFLKIQTIVPMMLVLLFIKKWKPLVSLCISQLVALIFSVFWYGSFWDITFGKLQAIFGFNSGSSKFLDIGSIIGNPYIHMFITLILVCLLVFFSLNKSSKVNYDFYIAWMIMCVQILLYHRIYDYFWMYIVVGALYFELKNKKSIIAIVTMIFVILTIALVSWGVTVNEEMSYMISRYTYYVSFVGISVMMFQKSLSKVDNIQA